MKTVLQFFRKGTDQFRWRYFSLRRMGWMSFFLFLFFAGWRLLFQKDGIEELAFPHILRHLYLAIFMAFISSFSKPAETETN